MDALINILANVPAAALHSLILLNTCYGLTLQSMLLNKTKKNKTSSSNEQLAIDRTTHEFLHAYEQEAQSLGDEYISLEHILLSLTITPPSHLLQLTKNSGLCLCLGSR
jgi:ATP-dependent Clp protease ATP-binding subunit ClpA